MLLSKFYGPLLQTFTSPTVLSPFVHAIDGIFYFKFKQKEILKFTDLHVDVSAPGSSGNIEYLMYLKSLLPGILECSSVSLIKAQ